MSNATVENSRGAGATMNPFTLLRILFGYVKPYTSRAVLMVLTLLVEGVFNILLALSLKFIIDYAITPQDSRALALILGGLIVGMLLTATVQVVRDYLYAWLGAHLLNDIRKEMFSHLQRLSLGFYARSRMGDLLSHFSSDLAAIENAVVLGVPGALLSVINIIFSTCVLFALDWRLALVAMLGLPLCVVAPKILGTRALEVGHTLRDEQATLSSTIQENLGAQQIVKAFSLKNSVLANFEGQANKTTSLATRFNFLSYVTERSPNIGMLLFNVLLISGGAYLAYKGLLSIGSLVSFNALFITVSSSVMGLTSVTPTLLQATSGMQRVQELLDEQPAIVESKGARRLPKLSSGIKFEDVTFGYTTEQSNLSGVNMNLPKGERVAFVGHSGCGKSTNLNLIMRFYDPQAGRVLFDGIDLREAVLDSLYEQVGIVFQESFLFNTSVRENIRLGKSGATDAEVEAAARAAELEEIIRKMPAGYDTVVGERGGRLSGGQRQRIAIARALIRNPTLIILDEATSALDPATEAAINETLERVSEGRTVVAVTHRLQSVVDYDQIFVFKEGRVIEQGTHESLLRRGESYAGMWRRQNGTTMSADGDLRVTDTSILRDVPLFADLDERYLKDISEMFITARVPASRTIIEQGDEGYRFYIIIRGKVAVTVTDEDENTLHVATLEDGDYFGEIALIADIPTTASVVTLTPCVFLILQREHLQKLMRQHAGFGAQLRDALERRMAETDAISNEPEGTQYVGKS
ncbi:MAG TPA: ATP-binding cassette domain-containing protein [Pyrinomonadaceae bacterium]|jgi:ATP-binding cassette subfamily B protein|nr:ATP-binding cassette domain-containing protein [Pyrinomonadaceae bacterium]